MEQRGKKRVGKEAGWATAHFPALVAIQQDCIATGKAQERARARHGAVALRHEVQPARQGFISRHNFYVAIGGQRARDTAQQRVTRHDSVRHGAQRPVHERPGFWVCALCARPSFETVHCLGSLFGSLFMDNVHEHCS